MGVFVYEYPRTGGDTEGPDPWGRTVHSPICHNSSNGSADHDWLATPGRRQEDKPHCTGQEWIATCARIFIFIYEYPHTGGVNESPAPWGRTVHSPICRGCGRHSSTHGSAARDPLATPGRRQEDKPRCKVKEWRVDHALRGHW